MPKKTHLKDNEYVMLLGMASLVGILGGYAAVLFRTLIQFIQSYTFPAVSSSETLLLRITNVPWYMKLAIPSIGGFVVALLVYYFAREAKGHGVPEVMESVALRSGVIRPRIVVIKAIASAISIGTGGSVGREGPIVQVCAALGSAIGQILKLTKENLRILVGCGTAAGIAATFNAPISGALFAVEIVLRNFSTRTFSPIVVSSVISTVVSYGYFKNEPAFIIPHYSMTHNFEILLYIILGILCGIVSVGFTKLLYFMEDTADNIKIWPPFVAMIGGLILGAIGIYLPHVMGNGYNTIQFSLNGYEIWYFLIFLCLMKIFSTCLTLSSGGSGGVFAPSLFIGATFGAFFGTIVHNMLPFHTSTPGAYALVGMGALVAGTTHGPITAIMVLYELTHDYNIILPLMLACIISTTFSARIMKDSIYTLKLRRRGVNLHVRESERLLQTLHVEDVMHYNYTVVKPDMKVHDFLHLMMEKNDENYYVVDDNGKFHGVITIHDLSKILGYEGDYNLIVVEDILNEDYIRTTPDEFLVNLLKDFEFENIEEIPVVSVKNTDKLIGMLSRRDIIETYDNEILKKSIRDMKFIDDSNSEELSENIRIPENYKLKEISVPQVLSGKTLNELSFRVKYDMVIVTIKRIKHSEDHEIVEECIIPYGNTKIFKNDRLLVVLKNNSLKKFNDHIKELE